MTPRVRELRLVYSGGRAVAATPQVKRPADAVSLLLDSLSVEAVEVCVLLLLDTQHRIIARHELTRGTLDACIVHPRDVFKAALLANAAAVILAHNHPSGDPTPSPDDIALCERLRQAAEVIGVALLDFVIIGNGRYHSFKEAGR